MYPVLDPWSPSYQCWSLSRRSLVQELSPVLEPAPSYAHVVASAATRNLRTPALGKRQTQRTSFIRIVTRERVSNDHSFLSFHRAMIRRRDEKADLLVKMYLSFFSLNRVIEMAKKIENTTFASIVQPWDDLEAVLEVVGEIKWNLNSSSSGV
jgi:hypothetical protein